MNVKESFMNSRKKTNFDILTVAYLKFVNNAVIIFLTIFVILYKRILLVFISYEL